MKYAVVLSLLFTCPAAWSTGKLTEEDRIEIIRGLTAEYATARVALPRPQKPLHFASKDICGTAERAEARK